VTKNSLQDGNFFQKTPLAHTLSIVLFCFVFGFVWFLPLFGFVLFLVLLCFWFCFVIDFVFFPLTKQNKKEERKQTTEDP
jgi:hypothetical protein